jgi:hypothetical protein
LLTSRSDAEAGESHREAEGAYPARPFNNLKLGIDLDCVVLVLTDQAMELILTGTPTSATEMERLGVVNRVISSEEDVLEETLIVARTVASYSAGAVGLAKQAVAAGQCIPDPDFGGSRADLRKPRRLP